MGVPPVPPPPAPPPPPPPTPPADPPKTFSQEELNRIAAEEKRQGKAAAERDIAAALGCTIEEAKVIIAERNAQLDATKTQEKKDLDAALKVSREATEKLAAAELRAHTAEVRSQLVAEGVSKEKLDRVVRLVDVAVDADQAAIIAAIEALKTDMPELFSATPPGTPPGSPPRPPHSDPGKPPPTGPPAATDARVKARLEARHPARTK